MKDLTSYFDLEPAERMREAEEEGAVVDDLDRLTTYDEDGEEVIIADLLDERLEDGVYDA